ncbi:MAG: enterotoxin [Gemmatimonadota bacterium]
MKHDLLTRRDFLERTAWAAAGFSLLPFVPGGWLERVVPRPASEARVTRRARELSLSGEAISMTWAFDDSALGAVRVVDRLHGRTIALPADVFVLRLDDGPAIRSSTLRLASGPRQEPIAPQSHSSRLAERLPGQRLTAVLADPAGRLRATWRAELRDGARHIRQSVQLEALKGDVPIREIVLWDLPLPGAGVRGSVKGSPVVAGDVFLGFEHPLSESRLEGDETAPRVRCWLARELPLRPGAATVVSSVVGVVPSGQLRRGFLDYVERERAHPYRTFLHYNSWYDLGYFSPYDEAGALDRIHAFGRELYAKRDVVLSSFLFDDGWDDHDDLWHFSSGFPDGFTKVHAAAARYGAAPGIWLSPWGGYGEPRKERLESARAQGFETNEDGLALSGPKYYPRFESVCLDMIRKYGVNQFKLDGTGDAGRAIPGSRFDSDFDAAIHLVERLREAEPDLYVNLTTGTYPSPFWLRYADSTWRGGSDHDFAGVGSRRQQWITYRDAATYRGVVQRGPLYPLNALMLHGLIYAQHAKGLNDDPGHDFRSEVRDYFGTGTQLQEMYITPSLLDDDDWDAIAEAARWSRANADTLVDTHWIGGDPGALEPYGWAAWSPRKGILTLRNPKDSPQTMAVDVAQAFELPEDMPGKFVVRNPWRDQASRPPIRLHAGATHAFDLAPFEVLTLEGVATDSRG